MQGLVKLRLVRGQGDVLTQLPEEFTFPAAEIVGPFPGRDQCAENLAFHQEGSRDNRSQAMFAQQLEKGGKANILKVTTDEDGNKKEIVVEFDPETREFIVSDTSKIMVPDMINNESLTPAQKENYRKGKEVALADQTRLQYSATDAQGIRSDKLALVASILIDGGLSYMVYKGLNALFNKERNEEKAAELSPGYYNAVRDMQEQKMDFSDNLRKARPVLARK